MARRRDTSRQEQAERKSRLARELDTAAERDSGGWTMTEEEWFASVTAEAMLPIVQTLASPRKLRLFMAGVCRSQWSRYSIPAIDEVLDCADRYPDDENRFAGAMGVLRARTTGRWCWGIPTEQVLCPTGQEIEAARAFIAAFQNSVWVGKETLAALLREVVGNPFRPPQFDRAWCTDTASILAQQMYDSRDFSAMPILADALQDAGCENDDVLNHCRGPGVHVCGCWVVDLVLGKS